MSGCANCRGLDGQSAEVDPRGGMKAESQHFTSDGIFETYRCRECGSQWQRFLAAGKHGAAPGPWKHLRRLAPQAFGGR
jgi:hypothetical protein